MASVSRRQLLVGGAAFALAARAGRAFADDAITLSNARLLLGDGTETKGGIRVRGGKIEAVGPEVTGGEDLGGAIEVLFFPNSYQLYATAIADDAIVIVKGKVDRRDDVPKLIAMDMTIPDLTTGADGSAPVVLQLPVTKCVPPVVEQLREVLRTHPGTTEVHMRLRGNQKTTVVRLDDKLRVTPGPALHADLKQLLGPSCIAS